MAASPPPPSPQRVSQSTPSDMVSLGQQLRQGKRMISVPKKSWRERSARDRAGVDSTRIFYQEARLKVTYGSELHQPIRDSVTHLNGKFKISIGSAGCKEQKQPRAPLHSLKLRTRSCYARTEERPSHGQAQYPSYPSCIYKYDCTS